MAKSNKTLFFFTSEYPFGKKSEPFIDTEILFLAKEFSKIIIFPLKSDNDMRKLPANAEVVFLFDYINYSKKNKILKLLKYFWFSSSVLLTEILDKGLLKVVKARKIFLDYLAIQLIIGEKLLQYLIKNGDKNSSYFYSYWFCEYPLSLIFVKNKLSIKKLICRAHRFDLYDESWPSTGIPFRDFKLQNIDECHLISNSGLDYIKSKTKIKHHNKMMLSKLGVWPQVTNPSFKVKPFKRIASCSTVIPRKRVDIIVDLLQNIDIQIEWVHFGDGQIMDLIRDKSKLLPANISVVFMGQTQNKIVLEYYSSNQVDLFISTSESEGIPVSMMEALSFGIPVLAVPVGGVPEIVVDGVSGFLFPELYNYEEYRELLFKALSFPFNPAEIIKFFDRNFNANINYTKFVNEISNIGQ